MRFKRRAFFMGLLLLVQTHQPALARRHAHEHARAHAVHTVLRMTATAYTGYCNGCSGRTALGGQAGYGVVAVDPRVIPLRTRLFIPGYGEAVAGDTGTAIRGSRIDLGFNSYGDAVRFGRREITVYILQ